jgi:hypothetical protein
MDDFKILNNSGTKPIPIYSKKNLDNTKINRTTNLNIINNECSDSSESSESSESSSEKSKNSSNSYESEHNYKLKSKISSGSGSDCDIFNF